MKLIVCSFRKIAYDSCLYTLVLRLGTFMGHLPLDLYYYVFFKVPRYYLKSCVSGY